MSQVIVVGDKPEPGRLDFAAHHALLDAMQRAAHRSAFPGAGRVIGNDQHATGLQSIERYSRETLAFDVLGVREKFVAGRWPAIGPKKLGPNIYDTFTQLLAEREIRSEGRAAPARARPGGSVGIFPESRVAEKRLTAEALSIIYERSTRAGLQAKLFVLAGDPSPRRDQPWVVNIDRNFQSLANAINSVDCVISADSLPAHLAEYFGRAVFVASRVSNEYWLPQGCFMARHWGLFGSAAELSASLDRFLEQRDA